MSYSTEVSKFGRIPTVFVECDMDYCANVYGTAPCTASVGVTGAAKCYNTYATCQDKTHFNKTTKTYRFCEQNADLPIGLSAIPLLKSVSFASQEITPNKGLGVRGSVSVSFIDAPWPDTEIDPYWQERTYDTVNQGTFWGKFKARNPFYENRVLRVRRGYLVAPFSWANFVDSVYVVEQLQGIAKDDSVKIVAKDILKLADDKKALFPKPSNGRLSADITNVATVFTLSPSGIGADYPASGKVAISGELLSFTRSGDTFTVVRGQSNTVAEAHKAEDTVQLVGIFSGEKIQDVIYTLLTTYSGISASYIDKAAWDLEASTYLAGVWSAEITEPTGINTLIGELTEQGTCRIWWDENSQQIRFRAVKPLPLNLPILSDESHFLTKTIDVKTDTNQRIGTVFIYYGQKLPTKKLDDLENYALRVATPNLDAISDLEYGTNIVKKIFSRWFKVTSSGRVNALTDALLKTYRDPPQVIEFNLAPVLQLKVGDLFYAQTRKIQDVTGSIANVPMEVVYAQPTDRDDIKYKAQQVSTAIPLSNTKDIEIKIDVTDGYNAYDAYIQEYGTPEIGSTVRFIVFADVLVTAATTNDYAMIFDNRWPSGVNIILINNGIIAGRGGKGGSNAYYTTNNSFYAGQGQKGGDSLLAQVQLSIDNQNIISVGSGGGGGGGFVFYFVLGNPDGGAQGSTGGGGWPLGEAGYLAGASEGIYQPGDHTTYNYDAGYSGDDATTTNFGVGGISRVLNIGSGFVLQAGQGGDGGGLYGQNGQDGFDSSGGNQLNNYGDGAAGGASGDNAIVGNSLITWINNGSIYGNILP